MKKVVLYFLTTIGAVWIISILLTGFKVEVILLMKLLVVAIITIGILINEWINMKFPRQNYFLFILLGTLINFFVIYIAALLIPGFDVTGGTLLKFNFGVGFLKNADQILTLMLSSFFTMIFAVVTKWASE